MAAHPIHTLLQSVGGASQFHDPWPKAAVNLVVNYKCERYEKASVIRGHHIYKSVWTPLLGEELAEEHNEHAVAVVAGPHDSPVILS